MRRRFIQRGAALAAALALTACMHETQEAVESDPGLVRAGQELATTRCASCHSIGADGDSLASEAPRFRYLAKLYHFEVLEVELREGVHVGDARMPQFVFTVDDTDALIAYLRSIQAQ